MPSKSGESLPLITPPAPNSTGAGSLDTAKKPRTWVRQAKALVLAIGFVYFLKAAAFAVYLYLRGALEVPDNVGNLCLQAPPLVPMGAHGDLWTALGTTYRSKDFGDRATKWLGDAIRIPTESYDDMGQVRVDPRWEVHLPFHAYLLKAFPLVHTTLELTKVNTYGLVYVWKGSDPTLKPLLLAAHQDVVPVHPSTVDQWAHPPYSGHFDGERIWGRGSSDDKGGLIGILSSIETLLEAKFNPTRTVVLAFGFDEEIGGRHGAQTLAPYLESKFGTKGFALLVDEGAGFSEQYGSVIATLAVGEKGSFDTRIDISAPGGHSSLPPPHTSIGILSALLVKLESHPIPPRIVRGTPIYETVQCIAAHALDLPSRLKEDIKRSATSDRALKNVERQLFADRSFSSLVGTTQAIDLIGGGVKTNALPEEAWAIVNHRIATHSSLAELKERDAELLRPLAHAYNLSYDAFGVEDPASATSASGALRLTPAFGRGLEPAPVTPTDGDAYALLSGTIKATYNAHRSATGDNIIVSPGIMSGNTDTKFYWNLTDHIFRYNHHNTGKGDLTSGMHTVNESITLDAFLEIIEFFTTLILNADESTKLE